MIQHQQPSSTSLQHNVVLHSNINESATSSSSSTNRFDLNISNDIDEKNQIKRQTNNLTTVFEQGSSNDLLIDDSVHSRSTTNTSDVINKRTTDEKQMV